MTEKTTTSRHLANKQIKKLPVVQQSVRAPVRVHARSDDSWLAVIDDSVVLPQMRHKNQVQVIWQELRLQVIGVTKPDRL